MKMLENVSTILIVDDLMENLVSLEALLDGDHLHLIKASSGEEALEILLRDSSSIALALLDVQMPGMNGFELAELMRGTEKTKNIPIIFLTAGVVGEQKKFKGYEAGAVDFIQKPIEADILRSKVNIFCELFQKNLKLLAQRDELKESKANVQRLLEESQHLTQTLKDQDKNKDEFLATLAHELRNPLAPLLNSLEILDKNPDIKKKQELHNIMRRQVKHLTNLVNDLMDLSRVNQGKISLNSTRLNLAQVIELALDLSMPLIKTKQHEFSSELPEESIWVKADLSRLAQVIGNLLQNAAKYTPEKGKISLTVIADQENLEIRVKDNGVGIPKEKQLQIFDVFKQLQASIGHSDAGLGIGLSLVRKLIELHGGSIEVESEGQHKGSTFKVSLPIVLQATINEKSSQNIEENAAASGNLKILIVDDNKELADTLAMMIELIDSNFECVLAHTGNDALKIAQDVIPDIILLDIGLPDISGYEVAEQLRQQPELTHTLLIAQSGWGQESDKQRAKEAGFDKHLIKPVGLTDLEELIKDYSLS